MSRLGGHSERARAPGRRAVVGHSPRGRSVPAGRARTRKRYRRRGEPRRLPLEMFPPAGHVRTLENAKFPAAGRARALRLQSFRRRGMPRRRPHKNFRPVGRWKTQSSRRRVVTALSRVLKTQSSSRRVVTAPPGFRCANLRFHAPQCQTRGRRRREARRRCSDNQSLLFTTVFATPRRVPRVAARSSSTRCTRWVGGESARARAPRRPRAGLWARLATCRLAVGGKKLG